MKRRTSSLWMIAALTVATLATPAFGQFRPRGLRRPPAAVAPRSDAEAAAPDAAADQQPTVEELLRRLDALEAEAAAPAATRERGLVLMLESPSIANSNLYTADGVRYFATKLVLINLTDAPITIPTANILLQADGKEFRLADAPGLLARTLIQFAGQLQVLPAPPESLQVPGGGSTTAWLAYAGIDSAAAVPTLKLSVKWERGTEELDINAYERGVLGLRIERLGPQNCAALLTVGGELNTINAAQLADALDVLGAAGVVRAVVAWGPAAAAPDEQVWGWLRTGSPQEMGMQYAQMPQIPAAVSELHLVLPPGQEPEEYPAYGQVVAVHRSVESAMSAALRTAMEAVPRDDLRNELARGHRLSRAAALQYAGARLGRRELPLVLAACDDSDANIRLQALHALREYQEPEALERLIRSTGSPDEATQRAAVASLAGSRFPEAHAALRKQLDTFSVSQTAAIVDVLARFPRSEWIDKIAGYYRSTDPRLRLAALRALVRLGHPQIVDMLSAGLADKNPDLRAEAYTQLVARTDPRSEELAGNYALTLLATPPVDGNTQNLLARTRDRRAIPLLLKQLDAIDGGSERLIQIVSQIGGADVIPELAARYAKLNAVSQAAVLEAMLTVRAPQMRPLAIEALTSANLPLVEVASRILATDPNADTVRRLSQALNADASIETWSVICNALANIGDSTAREALMTARRTAEPRRRQQANRALIQLNATSPAAPYAQLAAQANDSGDRARAEKLLDLAISFDPDYADAYANRGHIRLLDGKLAEAGADFALACRLDSLNSLAITGQAIVTVMQGDLAAGVQQIRTAAPDFPKNWGFEYNAACVYGRALEKLQGSTAAADVQRRNEYQAAALQHLRASMQYGFTMIDFIKNDADLKVLQSVPEFQELLAHPPAAPDPNDGPAGQSDPLESL